MTRHQPTRITLNRSVRVGLLAGLLLLIISVGAMARRSDNGLTQYRINELAGRCMDAQAALSGIKPLKRPGETHPKFVSRINGYIAAIDQLEKELATIRKMPQLHSDQPENQQLWQRIVSSVNR